MFKNFINNIKLSRLSYLLEIIEVRDFRSKINAYNKIKRMKLTKEMGLLILDSANYDHTDDYSDFNISLSLISLVFVDYQDEYSEKLEEIFPKLTDDSKNEVINLLSCCEKESAILLYKKLVLANYDKMDIIPVGTLALNKNNYSLLFPDLFKALKSKNVRNNIFLLLNDFLNEGVVLEKDLKKNKKIIQEAVINILKEGNNFKFDKNEYIMQNKNYIALRVFLETAINIEFYVSSKQTNSYLDKLYKKKDNQLKLFILDNYVRKGKDISKIRFNTIAKDELSRYPLFSFLKFYNLERLMPKKYANNKALSESDLYINYSINYNYDVVPFDFELLEERTVNNSKYYIYKFKTKYNYMDEVKDPATDYILKNVSIDKEVLDNTLIEYIGISGGFNKDVDPSVIETVSKTLLVEKYDDDLEKIINSLLPSKKEVEKEVKEEKEKKNILKGKIILFKNRVFKKKTDKEKISIFAKIKNKFKKKDKVKEPKEEIKEVSEETKKDIDIKSGNDIVDDVTRTTLVSVSEEEEEEEYKKPSILRRIFSFSTLLILIFIVFVVSFLILLSYIFDIDLFGMKNNNDLSNTISVSAVKLEKEVQEIPYTEIFNQGESDYYVLLHKKEDKTAYYNYLNEIVGEQNYKFYYVDLSKEENQPIYTANQTGFVIPDETLLKVKDKEYEFYVVGKNNILRELSDYIKQIKAEKEAAEKKRIEEELKKQKEEKEKEEQTEETKEE